MHDLAGKTIESNILSGDRRRLDLRFTDGTAMVIEPVGCEAWVKTIFYHAPPFQSPATDRTLLRLIAYLKKHEASVAIYPSGTTYWNRGILDFMQHDHGTGIRVPIGAVSKAILK